MAKTNPLDSLTAEKIDDLLLKFEDRPTVIMAASLLESILQLVITTKLWHRPVNNEESTLFEGTGPLATFSGKILIAHHLGLLAQHTKHDLLIIKKIRNECAHNFASLNFDAPPISDWCTSLKYGAGEDPVKLQGRMPEGRRTNFIRAVGTIAGILIVMARYCELERAVIAENREAWLNQALAQKTQRTAAV